MWNMQTHRSLICIWAMSNIPQKLCRRTAYTRFRACTSSPNRSGMVVCCIFRSSTFLICRSISPHATACDVAEFVCVCWCLGQSESAFNGPIRIAIWKRHQQTGLSQSLVVSSVLGRLFTDQSFIKFRLPIWSSSRTAIIFARSCKWIPKRCTLPITQTNRNENGRMGKFPFT